MEKFAIAIHGGAGTLDQATMTKEKFQQYRNALHEALNAGVQILSQGGAAIDAVAAAVISLEDCPLFNAGRGSVYTFSGDHEMDAAVMDGKSLAAAAVAGVSNVRNPVLLAMQVLKEGKFVFLSGNGAEQFARDQGVPLATKGYFQTEERHKEWEQYIENIGKPTKKFGTVGAVALDTAGNLAAATSTGGIVGKRYGRVGDSPVIGGGTYANNDTCAVSCTGEGEQFIRSVVAFDVSCLIEYKDFTLTEACEEVMNGRLHKMGGTGGLIAIDRRGDIQMPFNTEGMYRASYRSHEGESIHIFKDDAAFLE
jgi:L-asparaginase / beta-aspartyl-peptidase